MTTLWTRIFLLGSVLGVTISLILVSLTVWLEGSARPLVTMPNIREEYVAKLVPIQQSLNSVVERQLTAADQAELSNLRLQLLNLTAPAEPKEFHLTLLLKLNQLEDLLVQTPAKSASSLAKLQTELRTLLAEHQW